MRSIGLKFYDGRRLTRWAVIGSVMLGFSVLTSCTSASDSMSIDLSAALAADVQAELTSLARRARAGDKQAQLELGIRFEEGLGVVRDLEKAKMLYTAAAADVPIKHTIYIPEGGAVKAETTYAGTERGLVEANERLNLLTAANSEVPFSFHGEEEQYILSKIKGFKEPHDYSGSLKLIGEKFIEGRFVRDRNVVADDFCDAFQSFSSNFYPTFVPRRCSTFYYTHNRPNSGSKQKYLVLSYSFTEFDDPPYSEEAYPISHRPREPFSYDFGFVGGDELCGRFLEYVFSNNGEILNILVTPDQKALRKLGVSKHNYGSCSNNENAK